MDYSSTGTDSAWKVGLNYVLNDEFRLRANMARSVRAPNISELFASKSQTFRSFNDPCGQGAIDNAPAETKANIENNCRAAGIPQGWEPSEDWKRTNHAGFILGNVDLQNEVADDVTIGFVYNPSWAEGLGITVDYWKFELEDEINYPSAIDIVNFCYESESLENLYCGLLERTAGTFEIDDYSEKPINSASSELSGVDLEVVYNFETDFGTFEPRLIATYIEKAGINNTGFADDYQVLHGSQFMTGSVATDRVRWKARLITNYSYEDFSAALTINYRHNSVQDNEWDAEQNDYNDLPSYTTFDLTGRYILTEGLELRAGVLNMFDRKPPHVYGANSDGAFYDMFGKRLTVGVNYQFQLTHNNSQT